MRTIIAFLLGVAVTIGGFVIADEKKDPCLDQPVPQSVIDRLKK